MIKILPHEKIDVLSKFKTLIDDVETVKFAGKVDRIIGLTIESTGPEVKYGDLCKIRLGERQYLNAEVVGFHKDRVVLMPIGDMNGVLPGADVYAAGRPLLVPVGDELLGRVLGGLGTPIDGKGGIYTGKKIPITAIRKSPLERNLINEPLSVGIRAIDGLLTVGRGQRIGIFSGSGVGKSTLLGMIARYTEADVNVIALVGERGREVKEFVERELGHEGMKKSVVIAATSDQPPMVRLRAAFTAHAIAEYFRDTGRAVNLMMDSVTRFAMAQREVGLASGEPSATRGYPPSVFSLLASLVERAGAGLSGGSITGFYSVLVEGDDLNEPISDAVRGTLDGHIVLERKLAHKGHYPAIDILGSISRCMKDVVSPEHLNSANRMRELLAAYAGAEDLIAFGAYSKGADPMVDRAIDMKNEMNLFLKQGVHEHEEYDSVVSGLAKLMSEKKETKRPKFTAVPAFARIVNA